MWLKVSWSLCWASVFKLVSSVAFCHYLPLGSSSIWNLIFLNPSQSSKLCLKHSQALSVHPDKRRNQTGSIYAQLFASSLYQFFGFVLLFLHNVETQVSLFLPQLHSLCTSVYCASICLAHTTQPKYVLCNAVPESFT